MSPPKIFLFFFESKLSLIIRHLVDHDWFDFLFLHFFFFLRCHGSLIDSLFINHSGTAKGRTEKTYMLIGQLRSKNLFQRQNGKYQNVSHASNKNKKNHNIPKLLLIALHFS